MFLALFHTLHHRRLQISAAPLLVFYIFIRIKHHDQVEEAQSSYWTSYVHAQCSASYRTMVSQLVKHERIETTVAKAKEVRRLADNMVQLGKEGTLCAARRAAAFVRGDDVIHKLFTELAYRYK
ncbi:50S ribosomal protein L17 [Tanacetum coccineum]